MLPQASRYGGPRDSERVGVESLDKEQLVREVVPCALPG